MSFYNMLFGQNPTSELVLSLLDLKQTDIERFRDCNILEDGIIIYTRTGGGNREDYPNEKLTSSPFYLYDEDDDGDCTYATYYFKFPDELREDIIKLSDIKANGIPASIVRKCIEVANRPKTDDDKWQDIMNSQQVVCDQVRKSLGAYETNGHTIVPLSDEAMETLLRSAEKNDYPGREGEFMPYGIMPYKLHFDFEKPRYSFEKDSLCRINIDLGKKWEVDTEMWQRYKNKFITKYPKAINAIQNKLDRIAAYNNAHN